MKKKSKGPGRMAAVIILCCLMVHIPAAATQPEIDKVNDVIDRLEDEREDSRQKLEDLESDKACLKGELSRINSRLSVLAEELTGLGEQLTAKEEEIAKAKEQLEAARLEEEHQYENMKKRIRFLYEKGEDSFLEILLEAESFGDFMNQSEYIASIHQYDRTMLQEYKSTKEQVAAREEQLEADQARLLALIEEQQEKKEEAEGLLAQVQQQLNDTSRQIADTENEIDAYNARLEEQKAYEEQLELQKAQEDAKRLEEIRQQEEENLAPPVISDSESDLALLAALIECEAGGESYEGKLAVGSVVMNRVRSSHFPKTVMEVIYQSGQFSPVASGRFATVLARGAEASCVQAAKENLSGTLTLNCLYFRRNTGAIEGTVIGNHVFY